MATTIYLSSTYEDLQDYRRAVVDALRKSGHHVIAMEDYVATDQRPVEKCFKDMEEADSYVGLFAFRYGCPTFADTAWTIWNSRCLPLTNKTGKY